VSYIENHIKAIDEVQDHGFNQDPNDKKAMEQAIVHACESLRLFGESHAELYNSPIGEDGVLGECWTDMAKALIGMLNGESGRLDCGTVESSIRYMAEEFGFDRELT